MSELKGVELARAAINQILDHPESWDQRHWHCGTTHCFAGWCQVLAGKRANNDSCQSEVNELLGLNSADSHWAFSPYRTIGELHGFVKALIAGEAGFDRDGRDRDGRDRDGKQLERL